MAALDYLEGRVFCVVFVRVLDKASARVQVQCFRGRASVERGHLIVIGANGAVFPVPTSALGNILPSDGTEVLGDAEYFVMVRCDDSMEFVSTN